MSWSGQRAIAPSDVACGERGEARAHRRHFVADYCVQPLAPLRVEVGILEHVERGLHVGERGPAALGQVEHLPVTSRLGLVLVGDVVEQQHEAVERRTPPARPGAPAPGSRRIRCPAGVS